MTWDGVTSYVRMIANMLAEKTINNALVKNTKKRYTEGVNKA